MDAPLNPPMRLQAHSVRSVSSKATQKRLEAFLDDFQARTTASQAGNTAVTVQLQKLKEALREERKIKHVGVL